MKKSLLDNYSWIVSGSQRIAIIKVLTKPKTPKMISKETGLKFSNVSDCLRKLVKKKLVICLTPKKHLDRLYDLTLRGKELRKEII